MSNREEFLTELSALSRRYGIVIGGCGCCESPWLESFEGDLHGCYYTTEGDSQLKWKAATTETAPVLES